MKSTIGVYENHDKAVQAVVELKDAGFPVKQLSIIGKAETEVVDEKMHIMPKDPIKVGGLGTGTAVGATLGILTGVGLFAIPGLGFLYGAGALVGAIAGFDFGRMQRASAAQGGSHGDGHAQWARVVNLVHLISSKFVLVCGPGAPVLVMAPCYAARAPPSPPRTGGLPPSRPLGDNR